VLDQAQRRPRFVPVQLEQRPVHAHDSLPATCFWHQV
jgi:hypothetical protein